MVLELRVLVWTGQTTNKNTKPALIHRPCQHTHTHTYNIGMCWWLNKCRVCGGEFVRAPWSHSDRFVFPGELKKWFSRFERKRDRGRERVRERARGRDKECARGREGGRGRGRERKRSISASMNEREVRTDSCMRERKRRTRRFVCVHVQRGECDRIATKLQASKRVGISMMSVTGTFSLIFFLLSCQI